MTNSARFHTSTGETPGPDGRKSDPMPIAICGIGMRLPGSLNTPTALYDFLASGRDARSPPERERYNSKAHMFRNIIGQPQPLPGPEGYWLSHQDVTTFDPCLLQDMNLSRKEAAKIDPLQHLLLRVAWEALENAGETDWADQNIGCYVGTFGDDWRELQAKDDLDEGAYRLTGYMPFAQANRISYALNLRGPSMTVRTACSAGGVAVHLACQAIRDGDCDSALVASANLLLDPGFTHIMANEGVLSPEASCKTFDARADGYARAEAANCLFVKRLDRALADGNVIHAVIRGSACNSDGRTAGLTTPNPLAQEEVIRMAYSRAGIDKTDICKTGLVECHGTGTAVGDVVEACTIAKVFDGKGVYISSVKPNLGHSEGASTITSIIKAVVELQNRTILPNIKFEQLNASTFNEKSLKESITSTIQYLKRHPLRLQHVAYTLLYRRRRLPLRAFLVIKDVAAWMELDIAETLPAIRCLPAAHNQVPIFVFTGQGAQWPRMGAELLKEVPAFRADIRAMEAALQSKLPASHRPRWSIAGEIMKSGASSRLADAAIAQPVCTAVQVALVRHLQRHGVSPSGGVVGHSSGEIAAAFAAGVLTMTEAIVVAYYRGWVISQQNSEQLRERRGGMAAVGLGKHQVGRFLASRPGVVVACENSISSVTLSGDLIALESVLEEIKAAHQEVLVRLLKVDTAYHSRKLVGETLTLPDSVAKLLGLLTDTVRCSDHMEAVGSTYTALIGPHLEPKKPRLPLASSVSGTLVDSFSDFGAEYWQRNLQQPVLFRQAVGCLINSRAGGMTGPILEVGPHSALAGPLKQIYREHGGGGGQREIAYTPVLQRKCHAVASFLSALGHLHCLGVPNVLLPLPPAQKGLLDGRGTERPVAMPMTPLTDLPPYPWDLSRVCYDPRSTRALREWNFPRARPHELLGQPVRTCCGAAPQWRCVVSLDAVPWMSDHCIRNEVLFPAAAFVAMAGELAQHLSTPESESLENGGSNGFMLRDVHIENALVMCPGQNVEIFTEARPVQQCSELDGSVAPQWWEISIWSLQTGPEEAHDTWLRHCSCRAKAAIGQNHQDIRTPKQLEPLVSKMENVEGSHLRLIDSARWYKALRRVGYKYGPGFRGAQGIRVATPSSTAHFSVQQSALDDDDNDDGAVGHPTHNRLFATYTMHPTMIDHMLQALLVAAHGGEARRLDRLWLPTRIEEIFISRCEKKPQSKLQYTSEKLHIQAEAKTLSYGNALGYAGSRTQSWSTRLTTWFRGVHFSPLGSLHDDSSFGRQYALELDFKPDIEWIDPSMLVKRQSLPRQIEYIQGEIQELWDLFAHNLRETIQGLDMEEPRADHMVKHYEWIQQYTPPKKSSLSSSSLETSAVNEIQRQDRINTLIATLQSQHLSSGEAAAATLLKRCHDHAPALLTGKINVLDLLLRDHALHSLYDWMNSLWCYRGFFQLLSHKHGRYLKILEIGAGTGGLTARALRDLAANIDIATEHKRPIFGKYVFTDVSAGFFAAAKKRFAWVPHGLMDYAVLDISRDPREQGFQSAEYDLVIASNVLHATPDLNQTLRNVNMLLKPDGRLLLQELACTDTKWINFIMGFLPGWWTGLDDPTDRRLREPYLSPDQWNERLVGAGFQAAEMVVYDAKPPLQLNATIVARPASTMPASENQHKPATVTDGKEGRNRKLLLLLPVCTDTSVPPVVQTLQRGFESHGWSVSLLHIGGRRINAIILGKGPMIVSVLDLVEKDGWFFDFGTDKLEAFQQLISAMQTVEARMLWLTRPCQVSPVANPNFALCLGVARTVRVESHVPFATLEIDQVLDDGDKEACDAIHRVVLRLSLDNNPDGLFNNGSSPIDADMEFSYNSVSNNKATRGILIPRARPVSITNAILNARGGTGTALGADSKERGVVHPCQPDLSLITARPGALESLEWRRYRPKTTLAAGEVQVAVQASGLNFKDVVVAMGIIKGPGTESFAALGCEAAGIVSDVGASVSHLAVGDRVIILAPHAGCFSTTVQADARLCVRIPQTMTTTAAASIACVFTTVLRSLLDKANIKAGQTVLIHSAAGGIGLAALQVARYVGVKASDTYATAGSADKRRFLMGEPWNIPAENIFSSRSESFVDSIFGATCGRGVDVVLNSLSGDLMHASWRCVAASGTMVELGKRDILSGGGGSCGGKLAMAPFDDNRTFAAVDMARLAVQDPDAVGRLMVQMVDLYEHGFIVPLEPLKVFRAGEVVDAFRSLSADGHVGKVVVDMDGWVEQAQELAQSARISKSLWREPPVPVFNPAAIYILVGGLGGIGVSIARWMVAYGARSLCFLSRSAGQGRQEEAAVLRELQCMGCEVIALACDVSDESSVRHCISGIHKRIAGVLFLPMVLADAALQDMSISKWQAANEPKVCGAWNMHNALLAAAGHGGKPGQQQQQQQPPKSLDFFVLFSSTSGLCGYPGQVNYAAANSFLDAFSRYRRGLGLSCAVLDMGPVEDVGYVSKSAEIQDTMTRAGTKLVTEREMLAALQLAMARSSPTCKEPPPVLTTMSVSAGVEESAQLGVGFDVTVPLDNPQNAVLWKRDARMVTLTHHSKVPDGGAGFEHDKSSRAATVFSDIVRGLQERSLRNSSPSSPELESPATLMAIASGIKAHVFSLLSREHSSEEMDSDLDTLSWASLGVDSLVTIEMKSWWQRAFGARIATSQLLNSANLLQLASLAVAQIEESKSSQGGPKCS
ncbi:Mycolipanoate synthase [Gnomoniopsis sp. IMI 355080]|nr:Mycolipanoate synthase [Gnomoniopsis sp. IMI 355080]